MLLSFRVENHKSIREEQQLLLTPVYEDARPRTADWEAVTVAGIFGANASGKSNLLDALALMRNTVRWSMRDNEPGGGMPRYPFAFEAEARKEPSAFVVDLVLDRVRYTYGFAIDDERVVEEWLYSYPKRRKRVVFEREGDAFSFGEQASAKLRQVESITAENTLFLTVAARASNAEVEPVYHWFSRSLVFASERRGDLPSWLGAGSVSEDSLESLARLLGSAGTGVQAIELAERPTNRAAFRTVTVEKARGSAEGEGGSGGDRPSAPSVEPDMDEFLHGRISMDSQTRRLLLETLRRSWTKPGGPRFASSGETLLFHHSGSDGTCPLNWDQESSGTRTLATLGFEAQRVLESGGVLAVDEIDASLHPYLSAALIALFRDEQRNPEGAQMVFTSHDAALLGDIRGEEVLQRDHVWFVEKDERSRTSLFSLSDFKPRSDENRARRYLVGRYGAVPDVNDELFREALRRRTAKPGPLPEATEESLR
ncbi:AAA family ATPase [Nocardiopsis changdeensis]|uniref:ATP-binding protein n=1 Tax=Nocardiopsis changdeensis TaxID=2831969 RepID=A0ABX8BUF1_9ACTN|nr:MULTISPECIES: ATP-binding protein [Nocardiopsis]QUX25706.1 ATP-binding protein [Nocardiopsis changdeensis]QYX40170.1 ATP-binding protein [Nocardiopsis sp. MT53]